MFRLSHAIGDDVDDSPPLSRVQLYELTVVHTRERWNAKESLSLSLSLSRRSLLSIYTVYVLGFFARLQRQFIRMCRETVNESCSSSCKTPYNVPLDVRNLLHET